MLATHRGRNKLVGKGDPTAAHETKFLTFTDLRRNLLSSAAEVLGSMQSVGHPPYLLSESMNTHSSDTCDRDTFHFAQPDGVSLHVVLRGIKPQSLATQTLTNQSRHHKHPNPAPGSIPACADSHANHGPSGSQATAKSLPLSSRLLLRTHSCSAHSRRPAPTVFT